MGCAFKVILVKENHVEGSKLRDWIDETIIYIGSLKQINF
jgi:hypothetical protein